MRRDYGHHVGDPSIVVVHVHVGDFVVGGDPVFPRERPLEGLRRRRRLVPVLDSGEDHQEETQYDNNKASEGAGRQLRTEPVIFSHQYTYLVPFNSVLGAGHCGRAS